MSKSKHTPGPWIARDGDSRGNAWTIGVPSPASFNVKSPVVASIFGSSGRPIEEKIANAYLIAAAPDLLEACKFVVNNTPVHMVKGYNKLCAAITKAEGKE